MQIFDSETQSELPRLPLFSEPPYRPSEKGPEGEAFFRAPFFYSVLIHFLLFSLLLGTLHQTDRRPVKEVNTWVVNLVSAVNEEPKGPKTVLPEEPHALAGPVFRRGARLEEDRRTSSQRFSSASELPAEESSPEAPLAPPPLPEAKQTENAILAMQESAHNHVQMGQYRFRMKMGDQMIGVKIKYYQQNISAHLSGLIQSAIPEQTLKNLQGKSAALKVLYLEDGAFKEILFDSPVEDDFVKILKDKICWDLLSSPGKFGLPFRELQVHIRIDQEGKPSSRIIPL